jgi:RNA polymerase sigma-70 factor (ECF subfamily)
MGGKFLLHFSSSLRSVPTTSEHKERVMFDNHELTEKICRLRKFALRLTGNVPDAEDLVQTTVLRALEKRHLYESGTNLMAWTSKIMFNIFVSQYRRRVRFETKFDPDIFISQENVEAVQEDLLEFSRMREALQQLNDDHKTILIMVCVQGMKYEEAAAALQIPVGTVRSRIARARKYLLETMEGGTVVVDPELAESCLYAGYSQRKAA